jgi:hypothetical protein
MSSNEKVKKAVKDWFSGLVADYYDAGVHILVTQYKCLNLHGDYAASPLNQYIIVFFTSSLPRRVPPKNCFKCMNKWISLGGRSELYGG